MVNPHNRVYQKTYKGYLADQMDTEKGSVDNKPNCLNSVTRIPGQIGWGIERKHLRKENKMFTDDFPTEHFPIVKDHVVHFDKNKTAMFARTKGERAAVTDKKLGIDYDVYNKLNKQA